MKKKEEKNSFIYFTITSYSVKKEEQSEEKEKP